MRLPYLIILLTCLLTQLSCTRPDLPMAKQVIFIGVDGLSPDGIAHASTPHIDSLIHKGASSMHARGVMPTSSGANWGSMLLGAGPEQHGITFNGWRVDTFTIEASKQDKDGYFPSIFDLIRRKLPEAKMGVILDWTPIKNFFNNKAVDHIADTKGTEETVQEAMSWIKDNKPVFTFIHFDEVDHAGHTYGHGSPEYYQTVASIDSAIGKLVMMLQQQRTYSQTHIIISSDHGGIGKGHGGNSMAELEIPWIISGPGISPNSTLHYPINTYDTPATIAFLFSVIPPYEWTGRPVLQAFDTYRNSFLPVEP